MEVRTETLPSFTEVLARSTTEQGKTLLELVDAGPILLVFLRHFGCSYCRQAIHDVAMIGTELAGRQTRPVFVHLGTPERARPYFEHYGMGAVERVSDPEAALYGHDAFRLKRTHPLSHFLVPKVLKGWLRGGILKFGVSPIIREDGHQMPGVFVLRDRRVVKEFQFRTIADQPDYLALVDSALLDTSRV